MGARLTYASLGGRIRLEALLIKLPQASISGRIFYLAFGVRRDVFSKKDNHLLYWYKNWTDVLSLVRPAYESLAVSAELFKCMDVGG